MKAVSLSLAGAAVTVALAAPAQAIPNTACTLTTPVQNVTGVRQLPPALTALLPPIADIGAPFNSTDSVLDPSLPFRRLIRAGHRGDDWFLWYEHGGVGYFWQAAVIHLDGDAATPVASWGTVSDTLCSTTDAALAGRVPPYPAGTWAAGSY